MILLVCFEFWGYLLNLRYLVLIFGKISCGNFSRTIANLPWKQTNKVLLFLLHFLTYLRNWQSRCVWCKDAVVIGDCFHLFQHSVFDVDVFEHSLDYHVHVLEILRNRKNKDKIKKSELKSIYITGKSVYQFT